MARFGEFYHILHHGVEVAEAAKEKLKEGMDVQKDIAPFVALRIAAEERVGEMNNFEKLRAVLQACQFEEVSESLIERGLDLRIGRVPEEPRVGDLLNLLTVHTIYIAACLMQGMPLPGEP